jgi:small subunit ribosomal protein S13
MARIAGVDLPNNKQIVIALTSIYGIGRKRAVQVVTAANIEATVRTNQLSPDEVARLRNIIEDNHKVEGDLRKDVSMNIKRLMDIGCYRGLRHRAGLPVRGQQTQSNARTRKGPRRTVAGKKKATKK